MLRVLLNQYHKPSAALPVRFLSGEVVDRLHDENLSCHDASELFIDEGEALSRFHYSWIQDAVKQFPEQMYPFLVASLPDNHRVVLTHLMKMTDSKPQKRSAVASSYFIHEIIKRIEGALDVLPLELLAPMPLSRLLEINRDFLLEMIDLLGIYDLAINVKQIVNTVQLRKITDCLPPLKQKFLRLLISKVDKVQLPPLDLSRWDGDSAKLQKLIHRRGLYRLGLALSGYPADFMWHFTHVLDTGRAEIINRYYTDKENIQGAALTEQVLFIMNALTQKSIV